MKISILPAINTSLVQEVIDVPFNQLHTVLGHVESTCTKETCTSLVGTEKCAHRDVGVWTPTLFNGTRSKANATSISALVYDVDGLTPEQAADMLASLRQSGLSCFVLTTHSHKPNKQCFRVIIETDVPMEPARWSKVHPTVALQLGIIYDKATRTDCARAFFKPSYPQGTEPQSFYIEGKALEVDTVPEVEPLNITEATLPEPTSNDTDVLKERLKELKKGELGILAKRALAGHALAFQGSRNNSTFKFFSAVARLSPESSWEAIFAAFRPSLNAMGFNKHGRPYTEIAKEQWQRAREAYQQEVLEKHAEELKQQRELVNQQQKDNAKQKQEYISLIERIRGVGKGPYTPEEMMGWAKLNNLGNTVEDYMSHQIIEHKDSYYFLVEDRYTAPTWGANFNTFAREYLSISQSDIFVVDKNGRHLKSKEALLEQYGRPAVHVSASLSAQRSYYKPGRESSFVEALVPIREDIKPTKHEHVLEWFNLLGGKRPDKLLAWVAAVTKLDLQCSAIFLCGKKGTGKTLFATGLSKIWGLQPAEMSAVMNGSFNAQVASCPLLFADEEAPRVENLMIQIRKLTGQPNFQLKRKFLPDTPVSGCVRLVFAANSYQMLETKEELSIQDAEAIAERFLLIEPDNSAAQFIIDLKSQPELRAGMTTGTHIAETALWLRDNHEYERGSRFEVEGNSEELTRHLLCHSGSHSRVLEFLCGLLSTKPDPGEARVRVENGELYINAGLLYNKNMWDQFSPGIHISSSKIGTTLANLSRGPQVTLGDKKYFPIVTDLVLYFADLKQIGNIDDIKKFLGR